ncbi:GNAT family N-acetyltransferase [Trinickia violacea]|uniref:GNAT family N-acetyltransferase n=1 Tax=Trinickia violacea TaxID=2571746 RepID=A0A4P8INS1_9BURK|nr:GNAT family N-acetyltransferase [Trinickia violacea]QCP49557.1 GNAT family N-acetyltransferase [Trinickia violacea]
MTHTTEVKTPALDIRYADTQEDVTLCYALMRQLRPHLASEREFVERWRRQSADGYRLLAIWQGTQPVALAGFRVQENLIHGRFFYVDDLVTDESQRGSGQGQLLMDRLKSEARSLDCAKLVLDTALANSLGQRFYFRQGLLARALRFYFDL